MNYPDNNPKTLVGATKVPLHLVPPSATHYLALALEDGGKKYGPYNWRSIPISISTYRAAAMRHLDAFWDGEELAGDSKVHHLAHAMACMALMLDAMSVGTLVDDRPAKGAAPQLQAEYANKDKEKKIEATTSIEQIREALAQCPTVQRARDFNRGGIPHPTNCS